MSVQYAGLRMGLAGVSGGQVVLCSVSRMECGALCACRCQGLNVSLCWMCFWAAISHTHVGAELGVWRRSWSGRAVWCCLCLPAVQLTSDVTRHLVFI